MSKALLKYGAFTQLIDIVEPTPTIEIFKPRGDMDLGSQSKPMTYEDSQNRKDRLVFRYKEEVVLADLKPVFVYKYSEEK